MANKKKIYFLYDFLSEPGGLERELLSHAKYMKKEGYDVKILTCYLDKSILSDLSFEGIKIETLPKLKTNIEALDIGLCLLGFNNIKEYNPDLFISYSTQMNFLIRNKKTKKVDFMNHLPNFLYLEGDERKEWARNTKGSKRKIAVFLANNFGKYLKKLDINLVKKNTLIFANSNFTKSRVDKTYKVNSISSYPPLDKAFKPLRKKIKEKFIFSSSRIIPDKKYELLIEAIALMKNKLPCYVSGPVDEKYKAELEALAKKKKANITFLGKISFDELIARYSSASVFAFPTPGEDFGLVPAESLACGTPVVVWGDGAGPTEQVIHGVNGYHAKPYDLQDFADKMDLILNSGLKKENQNKIIASARKFSIDEIMKDFAKEIKRII